MKNISIEPFYLALSATKLFPLVKFVEAGSLGKVYYANLPEKVLKPALIESDQSVLLSFEDALIFTQNQPEPRARFVDSFESLKAK